ncbi:MAG: hypothetical protein ACK4K0_09205 [Flavobacteriales bacterium]
MIVRNNHIELCHFSAFRKIISVVTFVLLYFTAVSQHAADFSVKINRDSIQIGEPFEINYRLLVSASVNSKNVVPPSIKENDTLFEIFEVWESYPIEFAAGEEINGELYSVWIQKIVLSSFENGFLTIKPLIAIIENDTIESNALLIFCDAPKIEEDVDFKDIKEIYEDPLTIWERIKLFLIKHKWWLIAALLILISIIAGAYIYSKHKNKKVVIQPERKKSMRQRYMEELAAILAKQLWQQGELKQYHTEITNLLRNFISERFNVPTLEKTTEEIMASLRFESISQEWKSKLGNLLSASDLVKFAKGKTSPIENEKLAQEVSQFIDVHLLTEDLLQEEEEA